ncbi:MAG: tetratricopeptide repeat protein [Flavobacteriaceae bacterium]
MATYKKRGAKKSQTQVEGRVDMPESTTAEVFETLDTSASKAEAVISKYQNLIIIVVSIVAVGVLSYLGYDRFVVVPKHQEAVSELNQAQYYFDLAVNSIEGDSLFTRALNGGEGKYGFLDIIENYKGTPAAKLATYSAGMAYLNLKEYDKAINYLDQFQTDDILLSALSQGAIGDAFAQIDQKNEAFEYYVNAAEVSENLFSTPKYLFKAAMIGAEIGKEKQALSFLKRIQKEYPEAPEAANVAIQIGRLETAQR